MTITYTDKVANARLCAFSRLLLHWKGSIYKLMYKEMLLFCLLYILLSCIYRIFLNEEGKRVFERVALHCESFINLIPLSFVLGFYVALIIGRWWNQFLNIPWPDRIMIYLPTMISGSDEQSRVIRRTVMRYLSLGSIIVFQATSIRVKKRFPTMDHLVEAGIITHEEVKALDEVSTPHGKWWVPFVWCSNLVQDAFKKGLIEDSYLFKAIMEEIQTYRGALGMLYAYDWISVPLVYTQVTTLAVYTFFLGCTLARQFLDPEQKYPGHDVDLYIPLFTLLQFFFYMGWLKVAEQLINPFGEDDDDFELNWIIDRNMQVSLLSVDTLQGKFPPLTKDIYFGENPPDYLPYTRSSSKHITLPHMGSTAEIRISDEGMKLLTPMETIQEGVAMVTTSNKQESGINTPITLSHKHQNLMSGTKSPNELFSRTSLHSYSKGSEDGQSTNILGSTLVHKAKEKLGKWLSDQSSQVELNRLSAYHHNYYRHSSVDSTETLPSDILPCENHPSQFTPLPILPEHRNISPPAEGIHTQPNHHPLSTPTIHPSSQPSHISSQLTNPPPSQPTSHAPSQPHLNLPNFPSHPNHPILPSHSNLPAPPALIQTTIQPSHPKKALNILTRLSQRCPRTHTISLNHESQLQFTDLPKYKRSNYYRQRHNNTRLARGFDSQTLFAGSIGNVNKISAPSLPCVTITKPLKHKMPTTPFFKKKPPIGKGVNLPSTTPTTNTPNTPTPHNPDDSNPFLNIDSRNNSFWNSSNIFDVGGGRRKLSDISNTFNSIDNTTSVNKAISRSNADGVRSSFDIIGIKEDGGSKRKEDEQGGSRDVGNNKDESNSNNNDRDSNIIYMYNNQSLINSRSSMLLSSLNNAIPPDVAINMNGVDDDHVDEGGGGGGLNFGADGSNNNNNNEIYNSNKSNLLVDIGSHGNVDIIDNNASKFNSDNNNVPTTFLSTVNNMPTIIESNIPTNNSPDCNNSTNLNNVVNNTHSNDPNINLNNNNDDEKPSRDDIISINTNAINNDTLPNNSNNIPSLPDNNDINITIPNTNIHNNNETENFNNPNNNNNGFDSIPSSDSSAEDINQKTVTSITPLLEDNT